jgi:CHAD domain-containing protein
VAKTVDPKLRAAAAAGAAAVAGAIGKAARDRVTRRHEEQQRAYRLAPGEDASEGVRRIARGRIDDAADHLDGDGDTGEEVHDARKDFKRSRALVRLVRDPLGDEAYRRENVAFRDAGRRLSATRDAQVLVETLDDLARRYEDELPHGAFAGLRAALAREHREAHDRLERDSATVAATLADLEAARERVAAWPLGERAEHELLAPGLERIFRRGRRALRNALEDPSDETLHELRKRAKDLWHAGQIARPAAPKQLKKLSRRAHELSDIAGADHDLALLRAAAGAHGATLAPGELELLDALVARRQKRLRRRALKRGKRLYGVKPRKVAALLDR